MDFTFKKSERIVSQKQIDELFSGTGSHSLAAFPVRAVYNTQASDLKPQASNLQVLMSVPKKRFKHAVDRNRIKRQLREAWRHHKSLLTESIPADQQVSIAFIWLSDKHLATDMVDARVKSLLMRIAKKL